MTDAEAQHVPLKAASGADQAVYNRMVQNYLASQPAIPDGWQPIETAPKDGTTIWGYAEPDGDPYGRSPQQAETYWDEDLKEWNRDGLTYWHKLTHWMPLPPKPAK